MREFFNIFSTITLIFGIIFEILIVIFIINIIIRTIKSKKINKKMIEKLQSSNMYRDIFGKMTDEERREFEKTGKVTSKISIDMDSLETKKHIERDTSNIEEKN